MKYSWMVLFAVATAACGTTTSEGRGPESAPANAGETSRASNDAGAAAELARATPLIEAGDFAAARGVLEQAVSRYPTSGSLAYYLGVTLENLGDVAGAERQYAEAIKLAPDLAEAAINLGALYVDAGRFEDAVAVARAGLKKRPNDSALQVNLALALEGKGDRAGALAAYGKAVQNAAKNASLRYQYAALLLEEGEKQRAADELKLALADAGDDRALLASIGRALGSAGAFNECITALDRAIVAGDAAELRIGRGLCRHSLRDEAGAKADFESAVQLAPSYAPAHYYLGRSLLSLGKRDAAVRSLEEAARLGKDTPLATKAREEASAARKKK